MRDYLVYEVVIVGLLTYAFTFVIYYIGNGGNFVDLNKYKQMIIGSFLVGALLHLTLELTGINKLWCKSAFSKTTMRI